jgi:hypothetical protein
MTLSANLVDSHQGRDSRKTSEGRRILRNQGAGERDRGPFYYRLIINSDEAKGRKAPDEEVKAA